MTRIRILLMACTDAIRLLAERKVQQAHNRNLAWPDEFRRLYVARNLRRAVTATITELDADLLEDLMRVIKKVGKDAVKDDNGVVDILKLSFQLMEMAATKGSPRTPDFLVWTFNKIYQGLKTSLGAELTAKSPQEGARA